MALQRLATQQRLRREALARAPRARPFPATQHAGPASPPLSRRSPPASRPASAPPAHLAGAAAAVAGLAHGDEAYWQRWGLQGGTDFDAFLIRQQKHVARAEAKLERQRLAAAAAPPASGLSPGSARILERRQLRAAEAAAAEGQQGEPVADSDAPAGSLAWVFSGARGGTAPPLSPSCSKPAAARRLLSPTASPPRPASGASCATAASAATAPPAFSHRPAITARAAAKPGRTPEELHADWEARQAKLVGAG